MNRVAVAVAVLAAASAAWSLWRRPPRRLARTGLREAGIREPAIVQFTSRTCAPCRAAAPRLEAAAERAGVAFRQLDVGERPDLARRYGIRTVPTVALTGPGGRVVRVWTGLPDGRQLLEAANHASA